MAVKHIEPGFIKTGIEIDVAERVVAHLDLFISLHVESHGGRLVVKTIVGSIIVAINAKLHFQHLESYKLEK